MRSNISGVFRASAIAAAVALAWAPSSDARVTKIIIDRTVQDCVAFNNAGVCTTTDTNYESITGRAFGELDPMDEHNALITDINHPQLAPRVSGKARYVTSFFIVKPKNTVPTSGLLWHDVPNRGGRITISGDLRAQGDIGLSSAWQGDNAGATAIPANADTPGPVTPSSNEWVKVPVLSGVTGRIFGRIINRSGMNAAPLNVMGNPIPYFPVNVADNTGAAMKVRLHETVNGVITEAADPIPNADWKFCGGGTFAAPLPVTGLPVQVCMKNGFDAAKLYQLEYTVKDPYVLGAGTAAFRDVGSFFRYEAADASGTANPLYGKVNKAIIRGSSQSGNFTRHLIFLGMNEDEAGRIVHEGAWPLIAGRRVANNSRWGQPDGVLELYQMGSEGPQWWHKFPDRVRDLPPGGILDRCLRTQTCPKIVETFGGAEVFALKMTPSWVGTDPKNDIPLPDNVRRYYLPSSTHGGGNGVTDEAPPANGTVIVNPNGTTTTVTVNCPGNNWGRGLLRANPVPATALVNRMRVALREWVLNGTEPPQSVWPRMRGPKGERTLVEANQAAMGFPNGIPEIKYSVFHPENFAFPIFDYDFGPDFDHFNATGVPTNVPPSIGAVVKTMVPKVNADGNELGGVPTVQNDAPLGTYLGWNITAGPGEPTYNNQPFHAGQVCNYVGGMVPFAKTRAQRLANKDPRRSLEERYGTHAGYVAAVKAAADNAACNGYLNAKGPASDGSMPKCQSAFPAGFPDDWAVLVNQAINSNVCNQPGDGGKCNPLAP